MNYRILSKAISPPISLHYLPTDWAKWRGTMQRSLLETILDIEPVMEYYYVYHEEHKIWDQLINIIEYDQEGKLVRIIPVEEVNKLLMLL